MPIFTTNKIRDFNSSTIQAELLALTPALPEFALSFAGFEQGPPFGRISPFPEATRDIGRSTIGGVTTIDTASRGDIRIDTRNALTATQQNRINAALDAHDETVDDARQVIERQRAADLVTLRAASDAGIVDADLALNTKLLLDELGG